MRRFSVRLPADILTLLGLCVVGALFLLSLQNPTSLDDGLRHFMMAKIMRLHGIAGMQGWSSFFYEGYFHRSIIDPWFLSNVLLMPFTFFSIAKGLQLFVIAEGILLLATFLMLLRSLKLSPLDCSVFLALLVFGNTQFMGRFLFGRPYALMTVMTLLVLWALFQRRYILLSIFLGISVLLSQLFIFPLFVLCCALIALLVDRKYRESLFLGLSGSAGILVGFLLHPTPLLYVQYVVTVFLRIPFLKSIGLSREMQTGFTDPGFLNVLALGAVITLLLVKLRGSLPPSADRNRYPFWTLSILAGALLCTFLLWVRAIDILWPVLVLLLALVYSFDRSVPKQLARLLLPLQSQMMSRFLIACGVIACLLQVLILPAIFLRDDSIHSLSPYQILQSIPTHSRVLNLDWDHFFAYVAVRPDLQYATGIDRSFTYITDPQVSEAIYALEQGSAGKRELPNIPDTLGEILKTYPSDYIIASHKKFDAVIRALDAGSAFDRIGGNDSIAIYAVPDWYRGLHQ